MRLMAPNDFVFLGLETREHPMHVGGLELFTPPEGAGEDFARNLYNELISAPEVSSTFRRRPGTPLNTLRNLTWREDAEIDLEYHVRLSALPRPGRIRELLETVSLWHSSLLDRHRPLWEMHVVEGLSDGRLAVYTKIHHALVDGVTALRLLQKSLTDDASETSLPAPFAPRQPRTARGSRGFNPLGLAKTGLSLTGDVAGSVPAAYRIGRQIMRERDIPLPLRAPKSMFNVPIGGARRFAAQSWSLDRLRRVAKAAGSTLNDVVLCMCGGALREYLLTQNALPEKPLIAFVPVSLHSLTGEAEAGNAVTVVMASLGTDEDDPLARMKAIRRSMGQAKEMMAGLSPLQSIALGATLAGPFALTSAAGLSSFTPPTFNVIISNVPGPKKPLYWNGAKLDGIYPASIVMDGLALNITLASNVDSLDFGVIGCRQSVPHLQHLLRHLEDSLASLEKAAGL
ncbi:wax ester/triacylglycerol synthase family O-acyltransferase [Hoyosella sp. YIM 151337]|uniref:WS/DGAT/MGAT family O-acyltransferase n=1 Tax=Hoyosella sp. YIM 151337 TaxID=2992742 RepID=UPI00223611D4|nr:wax ester/triacylglycerol synthase family O-acyltransferase [Hoyosella sp. YIM 151337]MCW4354359.1 wax ester/triacylglycerol synthase family O-acyltransferase [Hoyosella sp. YIM 151337]